MCCALADAKKRLRQVPDGGVVDGCLHHKPKGGGGDITFDGAYQDFEFTIEKIAAKGNHVEHWLNGEKVVEYEFGSDAWKAELAKIKFKKNTVYGSPVRGQICLQDHQDEAWFRSVKILDLTGK